MASYKQIVKDCTGTNMNIRTEFDSTQNIRKYGFFISFDGKRPYAEYNETPLPLSPKKLRILEKALKNTDTGVSVEDYAGIMCRTIENADEFKKTSLTLKVCVSQINAVFDDVFGAKTAPKMTPLYARCERNCKANSDQTQAYIVSSPIPYKPDYDAVGTLLSPDIWRLYVDAVALSEKPGGLIVCKRRITGWDEGLVFAGQTLIPLSPLKTAVLADAVSRTISLNHGPYPDVTRDFGIVAVVGRPTTTKISYSGVLAQASAQITAVTGNPEIAERLLAHDNMRPAL